MVIRMKKDIYMIEVEELVFLSKANQCKKILVTKEKLMELLDSNYKVYSAVLVAEEAIDQYTNLGAIIDVK